MIKKFAYFGERENMRTLLIVWCAFTILILGCRKSDDDKTTPPPAHQERTSQEKPTHRKNWKNLWGLWGPSKQEIKETSVAISEQSPVPTPSKKITKHIPPPPERKPISPPEFRPSPNDQKKKEFQPDKKKDFSEKLYDSLSANLQTALITTYGKWAGEDYWCFRCAGFINRLRKSASIFMENRRRNHS